MERPPLRRIVQRRCSCGSDRHHAACPDRTTMGPFGKSAVCYDGRFLRGKGPNPMRIIAVRAVSVSDAACRLGPGDRDAPVRHGNQPRCGVRGRCHRDRCSPSRALRSEALQPQGQAHHRNLGHLARSSALYPHGHCGRRLPLHAYRRSDPQKAVAPLQHRHAAEGVRPAPDLSGAGLSGGAVFESDSEALRPTSSRWTGRPSTARIP